MLRRLTHSAVLPLATVAVLALAACSESTGGGMPVETNQVSVGDDFFNPSNAVVDAGTTVTWTWTGGNSHNVTWTEANPPPGANSTTKASGTHQRLFNTAGVFNYFCTVHPTVMRGSVTVQ